eukprot:GDKI01003693.1.p1 GENE.GDKI01003693.1~~GDKI01003693.1.p1  ORF type:complete len:130 (-),score=37.61 GDKI01003693.1:343-732(-)
MFQNSDILKKYTEIEQATHNLVELKQHLIDLQKKHTSNKEALRAYTHKQVCGQQQFVALQGGVYVKMPCEKIVGMLETEQTSLENEIDATRAQQIKYTHALRALNPDITDLPPGVCTLLSDTPHTTDRK